MFVLAGNIYFRVTQTLKNWLLYNVCMSVAHSSSLLMGLCSYSELKLEN